MIMTFRSNLAKKGIKTMKIFYKKDFQRVLEEKNKIEEEYQVYKEKSEKAITELNIKNSSQLKEITDLENQIIDKNSAIKRYTILQTEISEENSKLKSKLTLKIIKRWFMYTSVVRNIIMKIGIDSIKLNK